MRWLLGALLLLVLAAPAQARVVVVRAAGDIACPASSPVTDETCRQGATARLLSGSDAVLPLGDLQYPAGSISDFRAGYAKSWGLFARRSWPVPGNHEYVTPYAAGYFDYWGAPLIGGSGRPGARGQGYYSFRLGSWRLIALNSNCDQVPCGPGSAQARWLAHTLKRHPSRCTLAYWHHPRFSSGPHGSDLQTQEFWRLLGRAHADVVLAGHDHHYERFAPLAVDGQPATSGLRSWVVGTGGYGLRPVKTLQPGSLVRLERFGVLELRLGSSSYAWRFLALGGEVKDRGAAHCRA